jgi:competence protein ComEC
VTGRGCGRPEWGVIYEFKNLINNRINVLFTEPAASLVSGLLLGIPRNIPAEVINNFNRTGLTHIVAISGYNITLIISVFGIFLKPFGRRSRFWLSMGGIFIFVILTGMSSSVIRAAIMGALVLVSLISGRRSSGIHSLLISAAVMSLANPRILLFDISFQLSFLATLGILLFMPMVTPYFEKFKKFGRYIFEALAVTLSAQVFTVPLILFRYGLISVIAPLTNLIFLPLVPLIMFFAFLAIIVSVLIPYLTIIISGIAFILCELLIKGVKFFAELPMASLNITSFSIWMMIVYYAAVLIAFILFRRPRSEPDS